MSKKWRYLIACSLLAIFAGVALAQTTINAISGRVGPSTQADGTYPALRAERSGGLIVHQGRGKYAEAVYRGNCYSVGTAVAGVSIASQAQTTTGPLDR